MDQAAPTTDGSGLSWLDATTRQDPPLCYVVDREPGLRRLVAALLDRYGIEMQTFDTVTEMIAAPRNRDPDLILIDITVNGSEAVEIIDRLAAAKLPCPIQILSGLSAVLVEQTRRRGERAGLRILPVVHKPLQSSALSRTVTELGLRRDPQATIKVGLDEILAEGWLELWYQPTINLKQRTLFGAEAFVRAKHPEHGLLLPEAFLAGASERTMLELTHRVLGRALQDWPAFATIGVPIELSINVPLVALNKLSIFGILWEKKPDSAQWPGLTLEVPEEEAADNLPLIKKAMAELRPYGISMAIDNFGPRYAEFLRLPELPFREIKIDRSYIAGCDSDPVNRGLCETIVEFANKFQLISSAEGIETPAELNTLRAMGCEVGQGYLFARPQPKNDLVQMLRQRMKARPAA